jgi:pimeloyl-ACP methyl ester carboxylesterase
MTRRAFALAGVLVAAVACSSDPEARVVTSETIAPTESTEVVAEPENAPDMTDGVTDGASSESGVVEPAPTSTIEPADGPCGPDGYGLPRGGRIDWEAWDFQVETAMVAAPIDYDDPSGEQLELFVARRLADDPEHRIGSLLINPGGPGFGGSDFAFYADQIFETRLLRCFDIVGWDPRGTGLSEPYIDCIDDYDPYFAEIDITPDNDTEQRDLIAKSQEFADRCIEENDSIALHVGTNNSARDIDLLRDALGEDRTSYFGFSYGSELGATWATLFPTTVRAAVLDGASDPDADSLESSVQQLTGFEASLETFLAQCSADPSCAFHSDGRAAEEFDALIASLDADPVPTRPGRPQANLAVAINGVIQAMYSEGYWPRLARALASARSGDGSGLLDLHDSYYQRYPDGTYGNELEAFQTISCADTDERRTVAEEDASVSLFREVAPRLVPEGSTGGYFCTFFPTAGDPRIEITGEGAGPIVVIGTTGDPATPLTSTMAMADALEDGRLVVVEAEQHTGYGVNDCVVDLVSDYLVDRVAPDDDTECA